MLLDDGVSHILIYYTCVDHRPLCHTSPFGECDALRISSNNCIMFSFCLCGKQSNCFPGKHKLYMFSTSVFLEYRDDPQQWTGLPILAAPSYMCLANCRKLCQCEAVWVLDCL
jgi:hypothetical protein